MNNATLSIVICTYERPALLRRLIGDIAGLEGLTEGRDCVVVVDNAASGSAREVVEAMRPQLRAELLYLNVTPANIAAARNAGIRATDSDLVAFLDDDQSIERGWLKAIRDGLAAYPQDVLFGAVVAETDDPAAAEEATRIFSRRANGPAGSDLYSVEPRRTRELSLGTGNAVFRRATALRDGELFRSEFGQSGGEDCEFFYRLELKGCRFGWLPQAVAREFVPPDRLKPDYLKHRLFVGGQAFAATRTLNSRWPRLTAVETRLKAALQIALLVTRRAALRLIGREVPLDFELRLAGVRGKFAFGALRPLYGDSAASCSRATARTAS
jgi:succinoglycan biosynthesis protein ExoM